MRRAIASAALILSTTWSALAAGPVAGSGLRLAPLVGPSDSAAATGPGHALSADPTNRWIVVLKAGTDATAAATRQGRRVGFSVDHTFKNALRGYAAKLDRQQVEALRADPSVAEIVADERIELTGQLIPTGISRMNATRSTVAGIDGVDQRVDADVAIVDTGIAKVPDLNVVGGYSCSNTTTTAWQDNNGHGTHVAGTVGAIDDGNGVVGVAPGVRLWAVKILDDSGDGLLSWYVCGLDWIASQRDPNDPSRPLIEAANMSVAKWGTDDRNCGATNADVLHAAICRLVASGVTVIAAAGNDHGSAAARVPAAYNEVITVSALADSDGKPGGLGGNRCYSWGTYDVDDTFADFSNFGSDVDLIAPGKCIWSTVPGGYAYSSGTSMAAPHVTGAAALLKASRPGLTPADVREALIYLGTLDWKTSTDPDGTHERLLDASRIGPHGDFSLGVGAAGPIGELGGSAQVPVTVHRTATSFEWIRLSADGLPPGATASLSPSALYGFGDRSATLTVTLPRGTPAGTYAIRVIGDEHGNRHTASATVQLYTDDPTAKAPATGVHRTDILGSTTVPVVTSWPAASDPSSPITAYDVQRRVDGGAWGPSTKSGTTGRTWAGTETLGHAYQYRVRARDSVDNWSPWVQGASTTPVLIQDRANAVAYTGAWTVQHYSHASGGTTTYTSASTARARLSFTGRGIAIVAPVGPSRGSARIYLDGVLKTTVSFRATTGKSRIVMYSTTFAASGSHTIKLRPTGTGRVDLDAFVILR